MTAPPQKLALLIKTSLRNIESWFNSLQLYADEFPARGSVSGALVVLEHLKNEFDLDIESHTTKGGSQVKRMSGRAVKRILERFGERRRFLVEGGRTNRGLRGDIRGLLQAIADVELERLSISDRKLILEQLQQFLVTKVDEFFSQQRLDCKYLPAQSAYQFLSAVLMAAKGRNKEGPVAQYLVGAKLALRFPEIEIDNKSFSTADAPQDKPGDFLIGDTVFHVTVAHTLADIDKYKRNIEDNLHPWLLVPERSLAMFRPVLDAQLAGPFTLSSIEGFVAQNVAELAEFSVELLPSQLRQLLEIYNKRVADVEFDRSILIEIPKSLLRSISKLR